MYGLEYLEVISKEDKVLFKGAWITEYGYPIYTINHKKKRKVIYDYLKEQGVNSVGRWGSWHYWNLDRVFIEVKRLIECSTLGKRKIIT